MSDSTSETPARICRLLRKIGEGTTVASPLFGAESSTPESSTRVSPLLPPSTSEPEPSILGTPTLLRRSGTPSIQNRPAVHAHGLSDLDRTMRQRQEMLDRFTAMQSELEAAKKRNSELERANHELEQKAIRLEANVERVEGEGRLIRQRLELEVKLQTESAAALQRANDVLTDDVRRSAQTVEEMASLDKTLRRVQTDHSKDIQELTVLQDKVVRLEDINRHLTSVNREMDGELADARGKYQALTQSAASMESRMATANSQLAAQVEGLKARLTGLGGIDMTQPTPTPAPTQPAAPDDDVSDELTRLRHTVDSQARLLAQASASTTSPSALFITRSKECVLLRQQLSTAEAGRARAEEAQGTLLDEVENYRATVERLREWAGRLSTRYESPVVGSMGRGGVAPPIV